MLVLSRKLNESILIGESIQITVKRFNGKRVSLAILAPRELKVTRFEIARSVLSPIEKESDDQLAVNEQVAHSIIGCLEQNSIDVTQEHIVAICNLCNSMFDTNGGLKHAS